MKASWVLRVQRFGSSAIVSFLRPEISSGRRSSGVSARTRTQRLATPARGRADGGDSTLVDRVSRPRDAARSSSSRSVVELAPRARAPACTPARLSPSVGELLDAAQPLDVGVAVAAAAAAGAGRVEQALALVDAQRLRVDAGQLGGDRDDVDARGRVLGLVHQPSHPQVGARRLGRSPRPAPRPPCARSRSSLRRARRPRR